MLRHIPMSSDCLKQSLSPSKCVFLVSTLYSITAFSTACLNFSKGFSVQSLELRLLCMYFSFALAICSFIFYSSSNFLYSWRASAFSCYFVNFLFAGLKGVAFRANFQRDFYWCQGFMLLQSCLLFSSLRVQALKQKELTSSSIFKGSISRLPPLSLISSLSMPNGMYF